MSPATGLLSSTTTHNISMDGHSAHTHSDNEYSFHTYIMEDFFQTNFKQVIYNFIYLQMLPTANPTGQLLKVQLLRDLFRD
jgi:hypothetical protein